MARIKNLDTSSKKIEQKNQTTSVIKGNKKQEVKQAKTKPHNANLSQQKTNSSQFIKSASNLNGSCSHSFAISSNLSKSPKLDKSQSNAADNNNPSKKQKLNKLVRQRAIAVQAIIHKQSSNNKNNHRVLMKTYLRKMNLPQNSTRIFVFNSQDTYIKKALKSRGWVSNKVPGSQFFDLKWDFNDKFPAQNLKRGQLYNHFPGGSVLTSKTGLCGLMNGLVTPVTPQSLYKSHNQWFPRCYDLSVKHQLDQFTSDYRRNTAVSLLKKFAFRFLHEHNQTLQKVQQEFDILQNCYSSHLNYHTMRKAIKDKYCKTQGFESVPVRQLLICQRFLASILQKASDDCELDLKTMRPVILNNKKSSSVIMYQEYWELIQKALYSQTQPASLGPISLYDQYKIVKVCNQFRDKWPEYFMQGQNNVWIIKPGYNSRGLGVHCIQGLKQIPITTCTKVVQKYIEKPFLIKNKKFDIRQWVLVTTVQPLKIYIFSQAYMKMCSLEFDLKDLSNNGRHLANYSIQKKISGTANQKKKDKKQMANQITMSSRDFVRYLVDVNKIPKQQEQNWWSSILLPKMSQIVTQTIQAACENGIQHHSQCFELFGFDFVLDQRLNPWLLQVNLSPACAQRLDWLSAMLSDMSNGMLDLLQSRFDDQQSYLLKAEQVQKPDENKGKWILIQSDKDTPINSMISMNYVSSSSIIPTQMFNNLEIAGVNIKTAKYKHISKQFNVIKSILCIQRGVRCYFARKKRITIKMERCAILIQHHSLNWRRKLMKNKEKRDKGCEMLKSVFSAVKNKLILQDWKENVINNAAIIIQGLVKIKKAFKMKTQLFNQEKVRRIFRFIYIKKQLRIAQNRIFAISCLQIKFRRKLELKIKAKSKIVSYFRQYKL